MRNYHKAGTWNVICDVCGFKFKADQLKKRWDGKMVCDVDYELRNPQDLIRIPTDDPSVPWSRPESTDTYLTSDLTTQDGIPITSQDGATLEWA